MSIQRILFALAVCGVALAVMSCGRAAADREPAQPEIPARPPSAQSAGLPQSASTVTSTPSVAAAPTQSALVKVSAPPGNEADKTQALIDTARRLVEEKKWGEVLQTISQIKSDKLTPAQEKSLLELKDQLENMVKDVTGKPDSGPASPAGAR